MGVDIFDGSAGLAIAARPTTHCGGLAQLGERLHGMQEVSGSSPLSSTVSQETISSDGSLCSTRGPISMGLFLCASSAENH
jgi:hypothetical protein